MNIKFPLMWCCTQHYCRQPLSQDIAVPEPLAACILLYIYIDIDTIPTTILSIHIILFFNGRSFSTNNQNVQKLFTLLASVTLILNSKASGQRYFNPKNFPNLVHLCDFLAILLLLYNPFVKKVTAEHGMSYKAKKETFVESRGHKEYIYF